MKRMPFVLLELSSLARLMRLRVRDSLLWRRRVGIRGRAGRSGSIVNQSNSKTIESI